MKRCSVVTVGQLSTDHVASLEGLHTEVTISRRCADLAELLAAVRTGRADAALIIGDTDQLTETTVAQLKEDTDAVVVISDLPSERTRLAQLGLTAFDDAVPAAQLAQVLHRGGPGGGDTPHTTAPAPDLGNVTEPLGRHRSGSGSEASEQAEFAALVESSGFGADAEGPADARFAGADDPVGVKPARAVTAVWGISGAPGRTTVAVNLAAELSLTGRKVLLIDADSYAASAAVHLGLLEESAGIAQVCRAAEFGSLDEEALLRATVEVEIGGSGCDVLTGLPRSNRWTELRPRALQRVLELSRARYDHVVVDIGSEISSDQDLGFDSPAVQRNSAAQTVLAVSDHVIALGAPDPVGFVRLTKAVQLYAEVLPDAPVPEVVINKLRKRVIGRSPRRQLTETWGELDQSQGISAFLPWEPESCDTALRAGQVLAEAAGDSPLRQQIAALAGVEVRRRRRRLSGHPAQGRRPRRRTAD